jgi:hypothetical protein
VDALLATERSRDGRYLLNDHLPLNPLHCGHASPAQPRRLDDLGSFLQLSADLLDLVTRQRLLSDRLTALRAMDARPRHAGLDPAANDRPLEFGEDAEHLENGPSSRRGRVERLLMQI